MKVLQPLGNLHSPRKGRSAGEKRQCSNTEYCRGRKDVPLMGWGVRDKHPEGGGT